MSSGGRVAILARVSTLKKGQDESPDRQIEQGAEWSRRKGFEVVAPLVERVSGAKQERDRPALAELMRLARAGKINVVWVSRLDRLGRNLKNLLDVAEELKSLGVDLVVADLGGETIDTGTASGRLMFQVIGAIAEFVRGIYAEAAIAGKARAAAAGKVCNKRREVIPLQTKELIDAFIARKAAAGLKWTWGEVANVLKGAGLWMPGRSMADGSYRAPKPWDRTTLKRAYGRPAVEPGKAET
jgi:DNA invertase Pin-like site-specific DNA recombinase